MVFAQTLNPTHGSKVHEQIPAALYEQQDTTTAARTITKNVLRFSKRILTANTVHSSTATPEPQQKEHNYKTKISKNLTIHFAMHIHAA